MKIEIKSLAGSVLFEGDFDSVGAALVAAVKAKTNLGDANLRGADLGDAAHAWAQLAFAGHGESGRMLTAIQIKEGEPVRFYCGCLSGTQEELEKYIAAGDAHLRKTRTLALTTALTLLEARNDSP